MQSATGAKFNQTSRRDADLRHDICNAYARTLWQCRIQMMAGTKDIKFVALKLYPGPWCKSTEGEIKVCTWLREISSCSCLTVLPGPAWVLLSKTNQPLFSPLYCPLSRMQSPFYFQVAEKTHSQTIVVILIPQSPITSRSPISTLIYAPLAQTYLNTQQKLLCAS